MINGAATEVGLTGDLTGDLTGTFADLSDDTQRQPRIVSPNVPKIHATAAVVCRTAQARVLKDVGGVLKKVFL